MSTQPAPLAWTPDPAAPEPVLAATRWLAAVGVESHLDFDTLYAITAEPARLRALPALRRHLRACAACRRQWLEMRQQAACLGACLPLPAVRPPIAAGLRARLLSLLHGGVARAIAAARATSPGVTGSRWAIASIAGVMLIVSLAWRDEATNGHITAQSISAPEAARLLRSLGPDAAAYGVILESQGLAALELRLREDAPHSPLARRASCLLRERDDCP